MINELVNVADAMRNAEINIVDWHPKLKVLPKVSKKSPCIRVWLTNDGHIKDLELLSKEHVGQLRKYEPDYGKALPGFNIRPPFRIVKANEEIECSRRGQSGENLKKEWTKEFLSRDSKEQAKDDFWEKTRDLLHQCFGRVYNELESICIDHLIDSETLHKFFNIVQLIDVGQFQREFCNVVRKKVENGDISPSIMCYYVTEERKRKEDANSKVPVPKISVFLDIEDYTDYPFAHEKTIYRLNELLMKNHGKKQTSPNKDNEKDAFNLDAQRIHEKFPNVSLSFLGGVILRSQANTIPAQQRYHRCESDTFPVGYETRKRVKSAMEWISNPKRNGETYGVAGDRELLFAYPRTLPKKKITLTKMFGAQEDSAFVKEDTFERIAKTVVGQLKGLGKTVADAELEIFSLRKMDKARTKVVYYYNTTVASLEIASAEWHEGCQNIPTLDLWDWSEDKDQKTGKLYPIAVEGFTTFPIKLHRYLNTVWKRDGKEKSQGEQAGRVRIFEPTDGLRLLFEKQSGALAVHMLERFMQHARGYFLTLCRWTAKHQIAPLPDKRIYPGILGLLLSKLGMNKEVFMMESAFLLGRCLRVTDEIHRLYCEVVRKKDLPPELCGSSLLVSMMESPVNTLSQLAMRSAPYVKWARGGSDKGDKQGLVWYWLKKWEEVADQLRILEWPKRLAPEERAQVFLGYLASFPKAEKHDDDSQADFDTTTQQGDEQ